jgi:hypothetical protein
MDRIFVFLAGAGIGAAAGRWLNRGPALVRRSRIGRFPDGHTVRAVDVVVRTRSLLREIRAIIVHAEVPDPVLEERIRAKIEGLVARPEAVQCRVQSGRVLLEGTARPAEIPDLADAVAGMRGVREIENRLESLTTPWTSWEDAEPGSRILRRKLGSYPPSVSLALAAGGIAMVAAAYRFRREGGAFLLAAGAALIGAGTGGLMGPGTFRAPRFSRLSESSSWRPGLEGSRSAAAN